MKIKNSTEKYTTQYRSINQK